MLKSLFSEKTIPALKVGGAKYCNYIVLLIIEYAFIESNVIVVMCKTVLAQDKAL